MSQQDYQVTLEAVRKQNKRIKTHPEESLQFLIELGVLTPQGQVTAPYQEVVCIQPAQG
jgi:hypothetical protein